MTGWHLCNTGCGYNRGKEIRLVRFFAGLSFITLAGDSNHYHDQLLIGLTSDLYKETEASTTTVLSPISDHRRKYSQYSDQKLYFNAII